MDLSANKALEYLDYSNNGLTNPISLTENEALTHLDLSGNELKDPISLIANTALKYLDLSGNNLGESGAEGALDLTLNINLEELNLSNNGLSNAGLPKLNTNTALKVLNLSDNNFEKPADLSGNTNLEELDYSDNAKLTELNVTGLKSLKKVDVSGNALLETLTLDNCTSLTSLNIDGTSALGSISTVGMSDNQITDFSGTGTGLTGDALADLKNKVYTVTNYYTIALSIAEGVDVVDYTSGNLQVAEGDYLYLQFLPETAGGEVVLTIDGQEVEYKKNATGYSSYILNPIEKDYTISLNLKAYSVTFPIVEGITFEGAASAEYGQPYTFRMILAEGIDPENIDVYVNDEMVEPDPLRATTYTVTIDKVTGPIVVRVENQTVGIEQISVGRVYSQYGTLVVETTSAQAVQVYNVTGRQQFARTINGSAAIALTPGIYIVRVGSEVQKIVVR